MRRLFKYKISIDKKIISILGPHLYGDTASIISELIANSHDAGADNCWVTIKTGKSPEIIIEDDGEGMTPSEVNKYFLDIGYDRREDRPTNKKGEPVFGRKGIGKLAAFSLAKKIELYSKKGSTKAGCVLDYEKITKENKDPETIPDKDIKFEQDRLSRSGTGTRLVLKDIQKDVRNTYYYLVNRIIRNFNVDPQKFKIHLAKNDEHPRLVNFSTLDFFASMDTILTLGEEFRHLKELVLSNKISKKYKRALSFEELSEAEKRKLDVIIPKRVEVLDKQGRKRAINFAFKGWIGTLQSKGELKRLIIMDGASEVEEESISISDNRITIFSRRRIGEYDVLPKVQTDTIYDAYVIGELHVDMFEDDELVDMAISNRRGYEEADSRYNALIDILRSLVRFVVTKKKNVQDEKNADERKAEEEAQAKEIKEKFEQKTQTMKILDERLDPDEKQLVQDENLQFMRAARLGHNTKKIFISYKDENKEYGKFVMRIFELLGLDKAENFIFTGDPDTNVPHGLNIYDYLKDCFRDDIYVIFLFSRDFYDSNVCISETGAAWATNKNHTNIVIDVGFGDIDKPIDNARSGLSIKDIDAIDRPEFQQFVKAVYNHIGLPAPPDSQILLAIDAAVAQFRGKLASGIFFPKRKFQGCPLCPKDNNVMSLKMGPSGLYYQCRCGNKLSADIS